MLQLVYISSARGDVGLSQILSTSRRNNARDDITGLLYYDGTRFLQALEGPATAVEAAFERIRIDPRHRAIVQLSRRTVANREFGPWEMAARRPDGHGDTFLRRVAPLLADAAPGVRGTFEGFMKLNRTA